MRSMRPLAVVTALLSLIVASGPATGSVPLAGQTQYWKIARNGVKGLVVANETTSMRLAFHLTGLKPSTNYAMAGFTTPCGVDGGTVFLRDFTSNARGMAWDPVDVTGSLSAIASVRIRDLDAGADTLCVGDDVGGGPIPAIGYVKLRAGGMRGLAVVDETSTRRVVLSVSGLRASTAHTLVGRSAGCATSGSFRLSIPFVSSARGTALREVFTVEPATAGDLQVGSLRLRRGSTLLDCATPVNRVP